MSIRLYAGGEWRLKGFNMAGNTIVLLSSGNRARVEEEANEVEDRTLTGREGFIHLTAPGGHEVLVRANHVIAIEPNSSGRSLTTIEPRD